MRLNNWSIAASYDTARIFAGVGFGSFTASLFEVWKDDAERRTWFLFEASRAGK